MDWLLICAYCPQVAGGFRELDHVHPRFQCAFCNAINDVDSPPHNPAAHANRRGRYSGSAVELAGRSAYAQASRNGLALPLAIRRPRLFRLDVRIAARAPRRRDDWRLARVRGWRRHFCINVGRAKNTVRLTELFAERLIAPLLLGAPLRKGVCFELVVCAKPGDPAAKTTAIAARYFALLLMQGNSRQERRFRPIKWGLEKKCAFRVIADPAHGVRTVARVTFRALLPGFQARKIARRLGRSVRNPTDAHAIHPFVALRPTGGELSAASFSQSRSRPHSRSQ